MHRVCAALVGLLLCGAGLVACGGGQHADLSVTPASALFDSTPRVSVAGLDAGQRVTLTATTEDAHHHEWRAAATFRADARGRVTTAQRPTGGDYGSQALPGGLLDALHRADDTPDYFLPPRDWRLTVSVTSGGDTLARRTVTRIDPEQDPDLVRVTRLQTADGGLGGVQMLPVRPTAHETAVLSLGGSEGGAAGTALAGLLAAHGYPTLALAYFHYPGLPTALEDIPLEYIDRGVTRLLALPDVDRVVVFGLSRGSEAALLTALDHPRQVAGVVVGVPDSKAGPGLPDRSLPAWTRGGRGVPTSRQFGAIPTDVPAAAFDLAHFPGPVLALCGGQDQVWDSCPYADQLRATAPSRVHVLAYPLAGHTIGYPVPYLPTTLTQGTDPDGATLTYGGLPVDNEAARAAAWPKVLAFLARLTPSS